MFSEKTKGRFRLEWRSKKISLREIATKRAQTIKLGWFFDTLRDDLAIEFAGEQADELHDVGGRALGLHAANEGAVDLPNIGSKLAQHGQ